MRFPFYRANLHNYYSSKCWLEMAMTLPQVDLPVASARRWGNPQTAHLLVPDLASYAGSRACPHQHCAECSPKEYNDLTLTFSQQFSSHFCLPTSPFHREALQAILPHPFLSEFLRTHHSLLPSQGFLASTATPFPL